MSALLLLALFMGPNAVASDIRQVVYRAAKRHGVDGELLYAIYAHESKLRVDAINRKTQDYGLAQINIKNIEARGWDKKRILIDANYSAERGAIVLAEFKRRYARSEPNTWMCRYNIGNRDIYKPNWRRKCLNYLKRIERHLRNV